MKTVYVDNNATSRIAPEVLDVMMPYLTERYGNPSSMHSFGGTVGLDIKDARTKVAALIGAAPDEIVFTSCGSESDSTAIWAAPQLVSQQETHRHHPGGTSGSQKPV